MFVLGDQLVERFQPEFGVAHLWYDRRPREALSTPWANEEERDAELMYSAADQAMFLKQVAEHLEIEPAAAERIARTVFSALRGRLPPDEIQRHRQPAPTQRPQAVAPVARLYIDFLASSCSDDDAKLQRVQQPDPHGGSPRGQRLVRAQGVWATI